MTRTKTRLLTAGIAIIVLLAAAFFAVPFLSGNAGAEVWSGDIADDFGGGAGTADDPYIISNGGQLAYLAQQVNENGKTYAGVFFALGDDINLGGNEWTPISYGGYDKNDDLIKETKFEGTFDGAWFTIKNLSITENGANKHTGLFGRNFGTIKNLYLDNANIESINGIGTICAYNSGTIEACGVLSGTLKTAGNNGGNVGGICEDNSGTISKCYNLANIVDGSENGGICAINEQGANIKDCYNGGSIAAAGGIANGGICAKNDRGDISRCFNFGKLSGGTCYGVCGNGTGTMTDCFNDSSVSDVPVKGAMGTATNVENKTTIELCSDVFNGLGKDRDDSGKMVWFYGGVLASSADPDFSDSRNCDRFRITEYRYPSLNNVSKEPSTTAEVKLYYFRNGNDGRNYTADTYTVIRTAEEFLAIGNDTTVDKAKWSGNYVLGGDIDLEGYDVTPIGNDAFPFTGKFSGGGYSVKNAKIEMPEGSCVGLFGVNSGIITDLYVENATITGGDRVGGICGRNEINGMINSCAFLGTARATVYCGGVCAVNHGTIENCCSIGADSEADFISRDGYAGGVCGQNGGTIKTCYSAGMVSGEHYVGSVVGRNSGAVTNCYYDKSASSVGAIGDNTWSVDDETNSVKGLEHDELCGGSLSGFSGDIWEKGSNSSEAVNGSAKLRKVGFAYPYLKDVGEAYSVEKYEYNYGTADASDWQECTLITSVDEFLAIGNDTTYDKTMWAGNYALTDNIELKGITDVAPIGSETAAFTGRFGGNGYSVKNAQINGEKYIGVFGKNSGTITDLYVENAQIVGDIDVGGICGYNDGTIRNCAFLGTVNGTEAVGGICGTTDTNGAIENCYAIGDIIGDKWVGGLCGQMNLSTVKNCYSACTIHGGSNFLDALFGDAAVANADDILNCYYDINVSGRGSKYNSVSSLTTVELCEALPKDFGSEWAKGNVVVSPANNNFRTVTYTYPSLNGVGEAYSVVKDEFNYGTESAEDWQECTPIRNADDFLAIGEDETKWAEYYALANNIDLKGKDVTPIGDNITHFRGKFSGNGYSIENVEINKPTVDGVGLFEYNEGVISDLCVKNAKLVGKSNVGGICVENAGTIQNCAFYGTIQASHHVGGICGTNEAMVVNCYSIGDITGVRDTVGDTIVESQNIGGICGENYSLLKNCYSVGKVSGDTKIGSVAGCNFGENGKTENCYYDKTVSSLGAVGTADSSTASDDEANNVKGLTTAELCEARPTGFGSEWVPGEIEPQAANGRFRTVKYTYPSLDGVGEAYSVEKEQYNYKTTGSDDWAEYTLIKDEDEFIALTENPDMWTGNYLLDADLDLTKKEFSPIGRSVDNKSVPFTGKFSGNGHTITVAINSQATTYCGLFGENCGVIMNLAVKGDITGKSTANDAIGGICGRNYNGMVYGCSFEGTINATSNGAAGGICGKSLDGEIYNCYAIADVHANSDAVGGICGAIYASSSELNTCYFVGKVSKGSGQSNSVGAIVGYGGTGRTTACYYDKEVCNVDNGCGTGVTTQKLCELSGFSGGYYKYTSIWNAGSYKAEANAQNGRLRTVTCTYPSLVAGCKATSVTREQYNFGIESDDWAEYTVIKDEDEFIALTENSDMWSGNYILGRDLNLANEYVLPIGDFINGDTVSFTGKFSGNGHTISNVAINDWLTGATDSVKNNYAGVFGANSGTIMNLAVNGNVEGGSHVGGICGFNDANGVIYGCSFEGTVTATSQRAGGICGTNGYTDKQSKIINCYAIADVDAGGIAGGVCGENYSTVEYCYSAGSVTVEEGFVYDPVCFNATDTASSNYCYYNSELCGSGRMYDGTTTKNTALTTQQLCGDSLPAGFSADIWSKGSYGMAESGDKFRTVTYTYPSLNGVGKPYSVEDELQYNYGYNGSDDWQKCTRITTYEQFVAIGNDSTSNKGLWKKNYVLGADIDLGGKATAVIGDSSCSFTGKFSGNGHLFKNAASPLFGVNDGLIEYVTIESGSISYGPIAGSISVENHSDGVIYACGNNADVTVNTGLDMGAGGIAATNNGVISNCYNTGDVSSKAKAGGLCAVNSGKVEYSYNAGAVSGDNKTDALCVEQNGTLTKCNYNEDCGKSSFGSGLSTIAMTSKVFDGFGSLWVKKPNTVDPVSCEGAAYYPSFSTDFAPSEEFTLILNFVKPGEDTPAYGDDITLWAIPNIKYANGKLDTFEDGISTIKIGDEIVLENDDIVNGIAKYTAKTAGETKFTMVYTNANYFAGEVTKDLVIDIAKKDLTAKDFDFTPAADLVFNNKEKAASVTAKAGMEGVGAITVNYYCDGEKLDSAPINAGDYTVKISVGVGKFYNAAELEDSTWAFTIKKADAPAVPNIKLGYNWQTDEDVTVFVPGLPENMGEIEGYDIYLPGGNGNSFKYSDRKLYFHVGPYTEDKVGWTIPITTTLNTQNYNEILFYVEISVNNKANKEAPSLDDFDLVFTDNAGVITATIKTALEGVEYSFDGAYWSSENTLEAAHDKLVNAYIRYAATDDMNASAPVSKQANSGHGTLTHHGRVEPECLTAGSLEYWECELCARYFLDEKGENETTLDGTIIAATGHTNGAAVREKEVAATCTADGSYEEVVYCAVCSAEISREQKSIPATGHKWAEKYESDKRGHWHKCEVCSEDSAVEAHVSNGPATYAEAEVCAICGYEIAPKKNTGGNSGSGSGGSSGGANGGSVADTKPTINGKTMGWSDITKTITGLTSGSEATIDLNGNYDVPADVIKAIADRKIKATLRVDSWRSWVIDGAEITAPAAADLRVITLGMLDTTGLRGTAGYKFSLSGANNPAALTVAFNKEYAGKFANLYKSVDGKLVFVDNVKVGADGNVTLPDMADKGNYVIMLCEYSDRRGDANNDGIVNIADALALLRDVFGLEEARNSVMRDFNGDGRFDIADARDLLKDVFFGKA